MVTKHVLVIDDDPDIRDLVQVSLSQVEGWTVSLACSGEEGARMASERLPDLVLLDVRMPGLDGPATFERLRAQEATQDIPVVLLTANPMLDERFRSSLKPSGMIVKPFNPYTLAKRLAEILGW